MDGILPMESTLSRSLDSNSVLCTDIEKVAGGSPWHQHAMLFKESIEGDTAPLPMQKQRIM
jgi:hypothetical protein